ncbi:NAD(P)/FAD-dependent oxidoreductase [Aegicerativicinus sediminis]
MKHFDIIVVGGGAAGFFCAVNIAEMHPHLSVAILEKTKEGLGKVKISGGGRCNVTHAEFEPKPLTTYYPRGEKELLGPFHTFMTGDTMQWFAEKGVELKIEEDGRVFPISDSSSTIIDCFKSSAKQSGVKVYYSTSVKQILVEDDNYVLNTNHEPFSASKLVMATGSSHGMWQLLQQLGHRIEEAVPSLFTFNIEDKQLKAIPGVSVSKVEIEVVGTDLYAEGPLLVTHWGLSGPAVLKLSAFGAIRLNELDYKFQIKVNFVLKSKDDLLEILKDERNAIGKKRVLSTPLFNLPKRLWQQLVVRSGISQEQRWGDLNKLEMDQLADVLTECVFNVDGKSTYKEEFVTAGGIALEEVNFKTFESKLLPNLYFAGEILNIDGVTGGFNFQNAWTSAYIVAKSLG